jgi:hypothetical protein
MEHATDPEQGKMRKAASDGAQAAIWIWFLAMLAVLIVLGVAWGLRHRVSPHAPDLQPELPTLPGKTPEPQNP